MCYTDNKQCKECVYTPRKGTKSCYDCEHSFAPELYDGGCLLPYDDWQRALRGIRIEDQEVDDGEID